MSSEEKANPADTAADGEDQNGDLESISERNNGRADVANDTAVNNDIEKDVSTQNSKEKPDHGQTFVPGAGDADLAPKALDHFKRGYQERALTREKEGYIGRTRERIRKHDPNRERPIHMQGFDVMALIDRCSRPHVDVFRELDQAWERHREIFESGKALTAIIATAARRRNIGLAHTCWEWMDRAGMEKNVFHYNSMISVMEKDRNYQGALDIMKEMSDRNIAKNEVT